MRNDLAVIAVIRSALLLIAAASELRHTLNWPSCSAWGCDPAQRRRVRPCPKPRRTDRSQPRGSVPEAQSRRASEVVALKKAVRQSAIEFRVHEADVNIPLRCKLPVDNTRDRVQRTGTLRVLFAVAGHDPGERAEVGMLGVMVISGDHIHLAGNGVFDAGPIDVENP